MLLMAEAVGKGWVVCKVDVETGETTILIQKEDGVPGWFPVVTLDGKSVFHIRETSEEFHQIKVRDIETGKEEEFYRTPPYDNNTIALSPDGDRLALLMRAKKDERVLRVFDLAGGEPADLHRFTHKGRHIIDIDWSPDGSYIYFSKQKPHPESRHWQLWRVPSGGGEAQNLGLTMPRFIQLSVHPDGKRITFGSASIQEEAGAIWVMENFLPKGKNPEESTSN
jgi:Tol biopolymer transport system component